MKVLVTGGAGFIGSHIVDELIKEGYDVVIVDNLSTGFKKNINPKSKFYKVDIRDYKKLEKIFKREKPEIVNHHAAANNIMKSFIDPKTDAEINIIGTLNIIKASIKFNVNKIIYASSGGVSYGEPKQIPTKETHPINPIAPYGLSKYVAESYLKLFSDKVNFTSLRYASVYGPRQNPKNEVGVISIFISRIINNKTPIINGDGKQTRDFIYVKDVIKANMIAIEKGDNEVFNIGTQKETSIVELLNIIQNIMKTNIKPKFADKPLGEINRCCLDISKAKKILGWKPEYSLEEGLKETISWWLNESNYFGSR